jgi:hypothetical protein
MSLNQTRTQATHTADNPPTYEDVSGIPPSYREANGLPPSYSMIFEKECNPPPPSPAPPETRRTPSPPQPTATTTARYSPQSTRPSSRTTEQNEEDKEFEEAIGGILSMIIYGLLFASVIYAAVATVKRDKENIKLFYEMQYQMHQNKTSTNQFLDLEQALNTSEEIITSDSYDTLTESTTPKHTIDDKKIT